MISIKTMSKDVFVGIIIAAISIPIGMGYAQIAGLPAVYGLYGSIFPIMAFCLISSSPKFIFGVDAAPAALIGGVIMSLNIGYGSEEAVRIIPVLTMYTAIWLFIFYIFKAGRLVNYISTPVMGGFITGIGTTIILMQIPKIMGASASHGELFQLIEHIIKSIGHINIPSLIMGTVSLMLILISKKVSPRFPMSLAVMGLGALSTIVFHVDKYGVALLENVNKGLPHFVFPHFSVIHFKDGFMLSLPIAVVILAESLLAEVSFAIKNNYKINENREILAYAAGNLAAAFVGCCPVNGSTSRTVMVEQYGAETKIVSITAAFTMMAVLISATGFIKYLPVPVLTAIVISALIGVLEIHVAVKLYKINKIEFMIFMGAFASVLILGTIYGVVIGILLSFTATILKSAVPPRSFLGVIPGKDGFYDLDRNRDAKEILETVIYRFNGSLFFANINTFVNDIEESVSDDIKRVIVDAGGISSIDFTAAERLDSLYKKLQGMGITFYITEHIGQLNDEMRKYDLGHLLEKGVVRRTVGAALMEEGMFPPYPSEGKCDLRKVKASIIEEEILEEFEWAFGDEAEQQMEKHAEEIIKNITKFTKTLTPDVDIDLKSKAWKYLNTFDQDKLLEHLERHLNEIAAALDQPVDAVEANIIEHRVRLEEKMKEENAVFYEKYAAKREKYEKMLQKDNPKLYHYIMEHRKKQYDVLKQSNPEIAEYIKRWIR